MSSKTLSKILSRQCMKLKKISHHDANWVVVSASGGYSWCFKTLRGVENWMVLNNKMV